MSPESMPPSPPSQSPSPESIGWKETILIPTLVAGVVGASAGLVSKHRKARGVGNICGTYAANLAIVAGCYCGDAIYSIDPYPQTMKQMVLLVSRCQKHKFDGSVNTYARPENLRLSLQGSSEKDDSMSQCRWPKKGSKSGHSQRKMA